MDNVCKVFQAVNEELFPDGRQRPLGQSAGGHNNPLPPLQQENNDNADDSEFDTDNSGTDEEPAEDNTDDDDAENSSDSETDDEVSNAFSDSDDMADPGAAAAAGGGAGRTKSIIPTFAGEGNNIFEISTLTQEFIDSFLGYCQHARITHDRRLENLDQCLTGVAKKWYRTETKFVGDFADWDAFEGKFADRFGIELTPDARGTQAETLYIREGELCRNFIDRCRLYQYEVSQQTKQTIARALPACNTCDACDDCPPREEKIKRITDAVSQRECINLVICRLEEKMREEIKKLSEGKSFDEICKIIYHLENSSTKPTKDTSQSMTTASNGTSNSINALGYSGRGRVGGGGNRGGGGGGGTGQQRGFPQQQQPFQGNSGMYSIKQQQFLPPPYMLLPPQMTRGGGGGQCPPPTMPWGAPLGQQQKPPPTQSPAVQQPGPCGQPGAFVVDPNNSKFGGTYADFNSSPYRQ